MTVEMAEVWCARCDQPSVTTVHDEAFCATHALEAAVELLLRFENGDDRAGVPWRDAIDDAETALRLFRAEASRTGELPDPATVARAARDGAYAL